MQDIDQFITFFTFLLYHLALLSLAKCKRRENSRQIKSKRRENIFIKFCRILVGFRRSYVATAPGFGKGGSTRVSVGKMEQRANQEAESAWGPDPVTGYYRPSNRADEIDPVELREMLLKNKAKPF